MKRLFILFFVCIASYSVAIDPNDPFARMRERMNGEFPEYTSDDESGSDVEMEEQAVQTPGTPLYSEGSQYNEGPNNEASMPPIYTRPMTPPRQQAPRSRGNEIRVRLYNAAEEEARRQESARLAALREQELERLRLLMEQQRNIDAHDKISGFGTFRRG